MGKWKAEDEYLIKGLFDGGFLSAIVLKCFRWLCPFREPTITKEKDEARRNWMLHAKTWMSKVRGPRAEGRFAEEVQLLGIFTSPWQFTYDLHNKILSLAEALLNINRRKL